MVEVGSITVGGSIDTSEIERGQSRVRAGFESVKATAKSIGSDLKRMNLSVTKLASGLIKLGAVGAGAFVALAKGAPAVAASMAQISVQTDRLQRALGVALKPTFDKFAKGYTKFVDFVQAHPDLTQGFVLSAAALAGIAGLSKLFGMKVSTTVLTALRIMAIGAGPALAASLGPAAAGAAATFGILTLFDKASSRLAEQEGVVPNAVPGVTTEDIQRLYFDPGLKGQGTTPMPFPGIAPGQGLTGMDEDNRRAWLLQYWDTQWG